MTRRKNPSSDRNSIHYAGLRIEHGFLFFFVIVPAMALLINGRGNFRESERSWQTVSLFASQFSLLVLGSRRYVKKWRVGLKSVLVFIAYFSLICLFLVWRFRDNRTGIVAYVMLSAISFYGTACWSLYLSRRGDWGTWQLGESKKYIQRIHNRQAGNSRAGETPLDATPSDATPLAVRFTLPDTRTIRGESWQGAFVAEFSGHPAIVYWPTESKWRRVAPEWALPCWQSTLDQLRIWCEAEDAQLQVNESARIEFV